MTQNVNFSLDFADFTNSFRFELDVQDTLQHLGGLSVLVITFNVIENDIFILFSIGQLGIFELISHQFETVQGKYDSMQNQADGTERR